MKVEEEGEEGIALTQGRPSRLLQSSTSETLLLYPRQPNARVTVYTRVRYVCIVNVSPEANRQ